MSLFSELAKRKVFATGALYIPAAWLAAEIFLAIFDRFGAPGWMGDVVVVLFLLGFPVALLLSWLFDVTADGVKRATPGTPMGIIALLASGLFLSVGAYISFQVMSGRLDEIRIAILPLKPHATSPDAQPYGSGIADGLRTSLRRFPEFRVPAHASSEAVIQTGLDIPGIATKLGVNYIVEGTVLAMGDRFDIDVTLLDEGGDVLWSERFVSELRDLLNLQTELAHVLASQLGVNQSDHVSGGQVDEPPPTLDAEAYRLYLQGKYAVDLTGAAEESARLELLKAARDRDPGFALVYPAIAQEYATECWGLDDRKNPSCDLAINFARQGLDLDPQLADSLAILAMVHSVRYDYDQAQEAVDQFYALETHPILSQAMPWAFLNLGRLEDAWAAAEEFYRNDPLNIFALGNLALWSHSIKADVELGDHYDAILEEIMGISILAGFPWTRVHRISMERSIEEGEQIAIVWQDNPEIAGIITPPLYDPSTRAESARKLDELFEQGGVREPLYWPYAAMLGDVDGYMDSAFKLYDENTFNPVYLWLNTPIFDDVRTHPRYFELLEYIGIADYWDRVGWPAFCELREGERHCDLAIGEN